MGVALLITLLTVHGIIHITGAIKTFTGTSTVSVTEDSSSLFKITIYSRAASIWIVTGILFFVASGLLFFKNSLWWLPGAVAIATSQVLIIIQWKQARYGTFVNAVLLLFITLAFARWNEEKTIAKELSLFAQGKMVNSDTTFTKPAIALPFAVQKWLQVSGAIHHPTIYSAILLQSGEIRRNSSSPWQSMEGLGYFSTDEPSFVSISSLQNNFGKTITGVDKYANGLGKSQYKFLSIIPIPTYYGYTENKGYLTRFLASIAWFPPVALHRYITWKALDSSSAMAYINTMGLHASGIFTFYSNGQLKTFEETIEQKGDKNFTSTPMLHINFEDGETRDMGGIQLPTYAIFSWKINGELQSWCKLYVDDATYNSYYK